MFPYRKWSQGKTLIAHSLCQFYLIDSWKFYIFFLQLLVSLSIPELQDSVEKLFFYLLLGFQHSETAFHRIISGLPDVLAKLQVTTPVFGRSKIILERLVEATYFMLNLFPDFPDLYVSLHRALKEIPFEPPDEKRMEGMQNKFEF